MSQPPDDEDTWDETSGNPVHADQEVPVGAALAVLRIAVGLDPVELATACSVRALTILDYEQGRQVPALKVLERMLQAEGFPLPALESARTLIASLRAESTAARQPLPLARDAREFSPPAALGCRRQSRRGLRNRCDGCAAECPDIGPIVRQNSRHRVTDAAG